jgi:DNA-binding NarL/FixJ family response regulator
VLCVDDHPVVRDGVVSAINDQPDMQVVGEAASGEEAVALFIEPPGAAGASHRGASVQSILLRHRSGVR